MRITHDLLINAARDYVNRSVTNDPSVVAVYLIGSVLTEEPLLGGTTDIDLVYVHSRAPEQAREIHRFTDEVTLDIQHHDQSIYEQPRLLRVDPVLGPAINSTRTILYDTHHWFEYTQAIITAQFDRPDYHGERIRKLLSSSRNEWWKIEGKDTPHFKDISSYLKILRYATDSIASISGDPLTDRRFMLLLAERCQAAGNPQLSLAATSLLGFTTYDFSSLAKWIQIWEADFTSHASSSSLSPAIHPARRYYYGSAVKSFFEEGLLESCLWVMLQSWTTLAFNLSSRSPLGKNFTSFLSTLGFVKGKFSDKLTALDTYIDDCEEVTNAWAIENGV